MVNRIGILGGTFNPIHNGHLAAAKEVRNRLSLERVLFIPSYVPPHKKEEVMPSAVQRFDMVRLAIAGNVSFQPSDVEIKRGGKSYTIDTIGELHKAYPGTELYFITGLDSFIEIQTWHRWKTLIDLCHFVVISRNGHHFADLHKIDFMMGTEETLDSLDRGDLAHAEVPCGASFICLENIPLFDISSTDIRQRVKHGVSIKYLLPDGVENYIITNKLYV